MERTEAPFTKEQAESINGYQQAGVFHEFTCGSENCREALVATDGGGLYCPQCDYTQNWVHDWMANDVWRKMHHWMPKKETE